MDTAISATGLTKYYGSVRGIEDVDLDVQRGEVFGFLGPNGAGKSTTIRLLVDLLRPTRGSLTVLGLDPRRDSLEVRSRVGYVPGDLSMYGDMTGRQICWYFGGLRGLDVEPAAEAIATRLDLDLDRPISAYSTGNRQKVGLVQAFMHEPDLLILDEPTAGLDPLVQQEFYGMIREAQAAGRTVFLSSHVLPEVERIADRVAIIREGRILVVDEVLAIKERAVRRIELHFAEAVDASRFEVLDSVRSVHGSADGTAVILTVESSMDQVIKKAAEFNVRNIISHDGELEDVFLAYYRGGP
ncbi:MAG: ABC transporter ATP-binding protein [Acidimicrobiia bacterium]|nr:ABC transporter ATP-binding protein [Acidimicrobiia bacterium]